MTQTLDISDKINVLLVEDDPSLKELLITLVTSLNFKIETAKNGIDALELLSHNSFHTVISDLKMPGMDGLQLLYELRNRGNDVPVVLMTAYGNKESAILALRLGATDFIEKPFEPEHFLSRIKAIAEYGFHLQNLSNEINNFQTGNSFSEVEIDKFKKAKKGILKMKLQRSKAS